MEGSNYEESSYSHAHDFREARNFFDQNAGRSYAEAKSTGKTNADLLPKSITTSRRALFVLLGDVTGSMGDAPGVYFAKSPYLLHEISTEYCGSDTDFLFGAFGDGNDPNPDDYVLQFRNPLATILNTKEVKKEIMELITTEKGGGGQKMENSELAALYLLHNVSAPNAEIKVCIIITDEAPYDYADKRLAKQFAFVNLKKNKPTYDIFDELRENGWKIYIIQRPYNNGCLDNMDYSTAQIHQKWIELLGDDHVAYLPDIDRVVDVSFGILGDATDKYDYFMEEIKDRQLKDKNGKEKIDATYKALRSIHTKHQKSNEVENINKGDEHGSTKLHTEIDGKRGKKLL